MVVIYLIIGAVVGASVTYALMLRWRVRCSVMEEAQKHALSEAQRQRAVDEQRWQQALDTLKAQITSLTQEALLRRQRDLQQSNTAQIGDLLTPLRQQMQTFAQEVSRQRTEQAGAAERLRTTFEDAMRHLGDQTQRLGTEASQLTRALQSQSQVRGSWGEMILTQILELSGLQQPEQFELQTTFTSPDDQRTYRTDVIVHFPGGRNLVIDSKVTLAAYTRAVNATDDSERQRALADHLKAVESHVRELAAKKYEALVDRTLDMVIMFMPMEGAYIDALKLRPDLIPWAYKQKVVIASQTTLMTTLRLVESLWQQDRRIRNVEKIAAQGALVYEAAVRLQSTFADLGRKITALGKAYDTLDNQLNRSAQGVIRRTDRLRQLGVSPKTALSVPASNETQAGHHEDDGIEGQTIAAHHLDDDVNAEK